MSGFCFVMNNKSFMRRALLSANLSMTPDRRSECSMSWQRIVAFSLSSVIMHSYLGFLGVLPAVPPGFA